MHSKDKHGWKQKLLPAPQLRSKFDTSGHPFFELAVIIYLNKRSRAESRFWDASETSSGSIQSGRNQLWQPLRGWNAKQPRLAWFPTFEDWFGWHNHGNGRRFEAFWSAPTFCFDFTEYLKANCCFRLDLMFLSLQWKSVSIALGVLLKLKYNNFSTSTKRKIFMAQCHDLEAHLHGTEPSLMLLVTCSPPHFHNCLFSNIVC